MIKKARKYIKHKTRFIASNFKACVFFSPGISVMGSVPGTLLGCTATWLSLMKINRYSSWPCLLGNFSIFFRSYGSVSSSFFIHSSKWKPTEDDSTLRIHTFIVLPNHPYDCLVSLQQIAWYYIGLLTLGVFQFIRFDSLNQVSDG